MKSKFLYAVIAALVLSMVSCMDEIDKLIRNHEKEKVESFEWSDRAKQSVDDGWQTYSVAGVFVVTDKQGGEVTGATRDTVVTSASLKRFVKAETDWETEQTKTSQSTSKESVEVLAVKDSTWTQGKYKWYAKKITKRLTATVMLEDHSKQTNSWLAQEWTDVSVAKENSHFSFKNFDVKTSNVAAVKQVEDRVYSYGDTLFYTLGSNLQKPVATGTIKLKFSSSGKTFFPKELGSVVECKQLRSLDEDQNGGVDTWCIYFSKGYVLPVVVRNAAPRWDFSLLVKTDKKSYNGAAYDRNSDKPRWIPVYGYEDLPYYLIYEADGREVERISVAQAAALERGWNPVCDNVFSCKTTVYDFSYTFGLFTVFYCGKFVGEWSFSTEE